MNKNFSSTGNRYELYKNYQKEELRTDSEYEGRSSAIGYLSNLRNKEYRPSYHPRNNLDPYTLESRQYQESNLKISYPTNLTSDAGYILTYLLHP